eukprot:SAG22_NODE_205_length_15308_cov_20.539023_13_plen_55_part_00
MPVSIEMVVVLPAPLCPSSEKIWPSYMTISRLLTATNSPSGVGKTCRSQATQFC